MPDTRRRILITGTAALVALAAKPLFSSQQGQSGSAPKARPYPNGQDPTIVPSIDEPSHPNRKAIEQANQKKLRDDVSKLYEMASELKAQVDKLDPGMVVSISFVKLAQQIEKLAKQIKDLARS